MQSDDTEPTRQQAASIPTTTTITTDKTNASAELTTLSRSQVHIALDPVEHALLAALSATAHAYNTGLIALSPDGQTAAVVASSQKPSRTTTVAPPPAETLVFRVAGGWVRDKLLQLSTHDVDIAVNILTGTQAALLVKEYLEHLQTNSDSSNQLLTIGKIGVIAANPAQSKHLETATVRIGTIDVDFSNLRGKELYQTDSRIPTVAIGSALDDAMRRDFTLNALFYNLSSGAVEDWTGRGLDDLIAGRLVTPVDPLQTLVDDPLRVLRAIRFGVRYRFLLDAALEAAARNSTIHEALHLKVSRERVGKELESMLSGKGANQVLALQTMSRLHLAGCVFCLPVVGQNRVTSIRGCIAGHEYNGSDHNGTEASHIRELGWEESLRFLEIFVLVQRAYDEDKRACPATRSYDKRLTAVAAFLLPFRHLTYRENSKDRGMFALSFVFRYSIKFKNADDQFITGIGQTLDDMVSLLTRASSKESTTDNDQPIVDRLEAGLVLQSAKELWVTSLLLATVLKVAEQNLQISSTHQPGSSTTDWTRLSVQLYHAILDSNLDGCWKMKPLLDGNALIKTLSLSQGPLVRTYHSEQYRWMLVNPEGSLAACVAHLHAFKRKCEEDTETDVVGRSNGTGKTTMSLQGTKQTTDPHHFSKRIHTHNLEL
jgi:tRNA nucleotidyltransferase (CCA-adding enzyme)